MLMQIVLHLSNLHNLQRTVAGELRKWKPRGFCWQNLILFVMFTSNLSL